MGALKALDGRLTASADINYLIKLRNFPFQSNPTQVHILEGEVGFPQWRWLAGLTYGQGRWRIDWQTRFVGKSARFNKDPGGDGAEAISPAFVGAQFYHNIIIHYGLPVEKGKLDFYVGVNDLFDNQPPINTIQGNPAGPDGSALYDLGRYVFGGVRANF